MYALQTQALSHIIYGRTQVQSEALAHSKAHWLVHYINWRFLDKGNEVGNTIIIDTARNVKPACVCTFPTNFLIHSFEHVKKPSIFGSDTCIIILVTTAAVPTMVNEGLLWSM